MVNKNIDAEGWETLDDEGTVIEIANVEHFAAERANLKIPWPEGAQGLGGGYRAKAFTTTDEIVVMYGPKEFNQGAVPSNIPRSQMSVFLGRGFTIRPTQKAIEAKFPCNTIMEDGSLCPWIASSELYRFAHIRGYHQMIADIVIPDFAQRRLRGEMVVSTDTREGEVAVLREQVAALTKLVVENTMSNKKKKTNILRNDVGLTITIPHTYECTTKGRLGNYDLNCERCVLLQERARKLAAEVDTNT